MHRRAGRMQHKLEQPRTSAAMRAERHDLADAGLLRLALQARKLRIVAIEHRRAAGLDAEKDFRLGIGDRLDILEEFEMHRLHGGDDRHMRPHQSHQRFDLAGMVHADLEHAEGDIRRTPRQRQRHAPVIVERGDGGMGGALRRQHLQQHFLGRGLADRAGDGDHPGAEPRPGGPRQIDQRAEHVLDDQQRCIGGEAVALGARNDGQRRPRLQGGLDEIMAVVNVAPDREIGFAGPDGAAVDRQPRDVRLRRAANLGVHRVSHRGHGPQGSCAHATLEVSADFTAS